MKKVGLLFFLVLCAVFVFWKSESEKNHFVQFNHKKTFEFTPTKVPKREVASVQDRRHGSPSRAKNRPIKESVQKVQNEGIQSLKDYKQSKKTGGITPKVSDLSFENQSYYLLENKFAVSAQDIGTPPAGAQLKNNYYIVEADDAPRDALRVMQNANTGEYAIFTGILKVKLENMSFLDEILTNYDCVVESSYPHINVALIKFSDYELTLKVHSELQKIEWVKRSEVELLEYSRGSR